MSCCMIRTLHASNEVSSTSEDRSWTPYLELPPKKQLHALRATAIHSSNINAHALDAWQKHVNQLSSFMAISNKRFDNFANIV